MRIASWPTGYATDLLGLLNVLDLVELGPGQADLLDHVMARPSITAGEGGRAVRLISPATVSANRLSGRRARDCCSRHPSHSSWSWACGGRERVSVRVT